MCLSVSVTDHGGEEFGYRRSKSSEELWWVLGVCEGASKGESTQEQTGRSNMKMCRVEALLVDKQREHCSKQSRTACDGKEAMK